MKIKSKLLYGSILLAAIPTIIVSLTVGFNAVDMSRETATQQAKSQMASLRQKNISSLVDQTSRIENQLLSWSGSQFLADGVVSFKETFEVYAQQSENLRREDLSDTVLNASLTNHYQGSFSQNFRTLNPGQTPPVAQYLNSSDRTSKLLQYQFISNNKDKEKEKLTRLANGTDYGFIHTSYHPTLNSLAKRFGYTDIYLVDTESDRIVYSQKKQIDFTTSLVDGPFSSTSLGEVYRKAKQSSAKDSTFFSDFAPHTPSFGRQTAFIASPIYDSGYKVGVLVFQFDETLINRILNPENRWEAGYGMTGQTYLVADNHTLRSQNRDFIERPNEFFSALQSKGINEHAVSMIKSHQSTFAIEPFRTELASQALSGNSGIEQTLNYRGLDVFAAYAPVEILGRKWGLISEIGVKESLQPSEKISQSIIKTTLVIALLALLSAAFCGWLLARSITRPIEQIVETMADIAEGDGDLTRRLDESQDDEVGHLSREFNKFIGKIHGIINDVSLETSSMSSGSSAMLEVAAQSSQSTIQQQAETHRVSEAISQITESIQSVADHASSASQISRDAATESAKGKTVVEGAISTIEDLATQNSHASTVINELRDQTEEIGSVLDVIRGVAEQTNLLALNAAIEAARAGEHGRGFAVVADEVRTLASRTQESTEQINTIINQVQTGASNAVEVMKSNQQMTDQSVEQANQAGEALQNITTLITSVDSMTGKIATATEEQRHTADEVGSIMGTINAITDTSAKNASQTSETSESISQIANRLNGLVNQFKI